MAGEQRPKRYPTLTITIQRETEDRIVQENRSQPARPRHPKKSAHPVKTVYYNSNYRSKSLKTRQVDLDWDHTFDLLAKQSDRDNQSTISLTSSSDQSSLSG